MSSASPGSALPSPGLALADSQANPADYLPARPQANGTVSHSTQPQDAAAGTVSFQYCDWNLVVSLAAKGFTILSGQSGTGKSRSGIVLSKALAQLDPDGNGDSSWVLVPVGADWTDVRPLLGYRHPFGKPRAMPDGGKTTETYEVTPVLRLLLAAADPDRGLTPHFILLDEMNLSHVERYFSSLLSLMEANRSVKAGSRIPLLDQATLSLIADVLEAERPESPDGIAASKLRAIGNGLPLTDNVFVIGTVNVDETTYMFSPKVLDRAHVLELDSVPPGEYMDADSQSPSPTGAPTPGSLRSDQALAVLQWAIELRRSAHAPRGPHDMMTLAQSLNGVDAGALSTVTDQSRRLLDGAYKLLGGVGFGFGYRVVNEFFMYLLAWLKASSITGDIGSATEHPLNAALDRAFAQKILPKIHGNRRQLGDSLEAVRAFLAGSDQNSSPKASYQLGDAPEIGIEDTEVFNLGVPDQMPLSRAKLARMNRTLMATGYVTFVQ